MSGEEGENSLIDRNRESSEGDFGFVFNFVKDETVFDSFFRFGKDIVFPLKTIDVERFFEGKIEFFKVVGRDGVDNDLFGFFRRMVELETEETIIVGFVKVDNFSTGEVGEVSRDVGDLDGVTR